MTKANLIIKPYNRKAKRPYNRLKTELAKRVYLIIMAIWAALPITSCQNFRDDNGDLGGMWQLTRWMTRSSSGRIDSLVATNDTAATHYPMTIYYSIHRQSMQLQDGVAGNELYSSSRNNSYICTFRHTPDSLILVNVYNRKQEIMTDGNAPDRDYSKYRDFGVPADGRFHIDLLTDKAMQLSTADDQLTFRKY